MSEKCNPSCEAGSYCSNGVCRPKPNIPIVGVLGHRRRFRAGASSSRSAGPQAGGIGSGNEVSTLNLVLISGGVLVVLAIVVAVIFKFTRKAHVPLEDPEPSPTV